MKIVVAMGLHATGLHIGSNRVHSALQSDACFWKALEREQNQNNTSTHSNSNNNTNWRAVSYKPSCKMHTTHVSSQLHIIEVIGSNQQKHQQQQKLFIYII